MSEVGEQERAFSRGAARGACIFCKIVAGDAPAQRVHEDESTLSFMDLFPASRGHLLVVPKRHFSDILGADEASLVRVIAASRRLALAIERALAPDGIGGHQLNGAAAGQTVFHYHMHLIPRRMGDPMGFHGRKKADANELAEVAAAAATAWQFTQRSCWNVGMITKPKNPGTVAVRQVV